MELTSRSIGPAGVLSSLTGRSQANSGKGGSLLSSLAAPARAQIAAITEGTLDGARRPAAVVANGVTAEAPEVAETAQFASPELLEAPGRAGSGLADTEASDAEASDAEIEEEEETEDAPPEKAAPSPEKLAFLATLQRAKEGDLKAFEEIYQLYHRRIYNAVYGMLGDPDDAQDVTQDVFMRLHDALPTLRADEAFSTYLYRIALNLCRDRARRKKRVRFQSMDTPRADDDGDVEPMDFPDQGKLPEELITGDELQRRVREAVLTLSDDHKAVIVMHHFQSMEVNDIARILKVPTGTVKSRLARGRDQLHRKLRSYLNF
jgi:RNA polymerase sigma-70 factor (ECF subfamily)